LFKYFANAAVPETGVAVIFLDPPYKFLRERPEQLAGLAAGLAKHLSPDGVVVFRHDVADRLDLPSLPKADERTYGGMTLEFLRRRAE